VLLDKYKKKLLSYKSKLLLLQAQNSELLQGKSAVRFFFSSFFLLISEGHNPPLQSSTHQPDSQSSDVSILKTKLQAYKLKLKHQNDACMPVALSHSIIYSLVKELTTENASLNVQVESLQESMLSLVKQLEDSQRNVRFHFLDRQVHDLGGPCTSRESEYEKKVSAGDGL
jgi:hypothetical protein